MPSTFSSTLTLTPSFEQSKRNTVPLTAWPPILLTPSMINDSNALMSAGEPPYLGLTLSARALAIFSAPMLYTISRTKDVIGVDKSKDRAVVPSAPEDAAPITAAELYMATA